MSKTHSMTGYGISEKKIGPTNYKIEVRSLNSARQAEINVKASQNLKYLEIPLRDLIKNTLVRGKIELSISESIDPKEQKPFNTSVVESYIKALKKVQKKEMLSPHTDLLAIALRLPDSTSPQKNKFNQTQEKQFLTLVKKTLDKLIDYRITEGKKLEKDLLKNINQIQKDLLKVQKEDQKRLVKIKQRITEKIAQANAPSIDQNRLEQELIYYSEKIDINEEIIRLNAHLPLFIQTLKKNQIKGKKLNFISQEIGREINTIGSKAQDAAIQKTVVDMKEALEKIKEQLANVL